MKLEKREITLNERDSLLDMYFFERLLEKEYAFGVVMAERKETERVLAQAETDAHAIAESVYSLVEKSEKNKGGLLWKEDESF